MAEENKIGNLYPAWFIYDFRFLGGGFSAVFWISTSLVGQCSVNFRKEICDQIVRRRKKNPEYEFQI